MELETSSLEEVCELIIDCPHSTPVWTDSGTIVLRNQNIRNGRLDLSNPSFTDEEHYQHRIKRAEPQPGDIVFTREAPMGEVCMIPEDLRCCLGQRQVLLRPREEIDGHYLFYALQSPFVRHQILWNEGTGSTVSNVRIPVLKRIRIPRQSNESTIADILSPLDDKIELNRRMNRTLEETAQAIFRSWFVDFDPVKAKMRANELDCDPERAAMAALAGKLRVPNDPNELSEEDLAAAEAELATLAEAQRARLAETAALFPAELVDSELGLVPKSWKVDRLSAAIEIIGGGTPAKAQKSYWGGSIPWFSVKDTPRGNDMFVLDTEEKITELGLRSSSSRLLPVGAVIISARGTVGKLAIVGVPLAMNQSCYGIIGANGIPSFYTYFNLQEAVEELKHNTHGAVFDTITKKTFDTVFQAMPDKELIRHFESNVTALCNRIRLNGIQTSIFTQLRDTLLPKLLSGELRVPEAQAVMETAC